MSPGRKPTTSTLNTTPNTPLQDTTNHGLNRLLVKLPQEILCEIFSWCCPTFDDRFSSPPMSALKLSHVCQQWRKAIFNAPQLWTYTSLGAPRHNCESATELMLLWVSNSKTCPLVIDIDFSKLAEYKKPDAILPTVLELAELASDLKTIHSANDMPLTVAIEPSVSIDFPNVSEEYYWSNEEITTGSLRRGSLQLRVATKPCILMGMDGHQKFGPYLVHLDLRDLEGNICLTTEEALDIMKVYKNLKSLAIRLGYSGDAHENYSLTKLKTLAITWLDEVDPAPVLNSLDAPALENLELDGQLPPIDFLSGNIWDSLRNFLQRSEPSLRSLDLYRLRCEDIDLLGCLGRCEALERLWLEELTVTERMLNELAEGRHPLKAAAQRTLENLRTLGLVRCKFPNALQLFDSLVVSGLVWNVTTLSGLYISDCNVHEGAIESWHLLKSHYEAGNYQGIS